MIIGHPMREHIYQEIDRLIEQSKTPPLRCLSAHLNEIDLCVSSAKLVYYDASQDSMIALRDILRSAASCVLALQDHGEPLLEELKQR